MNDKLKSDFPIEWEDDHFVTRREFFRFMTLASGALSVGTVAMSVGPRLSRRELRFEPAMVCRIEELLPGSAMPFTFPRPSDLCILIRRLDGEFAAFGRRCTHLSCPVNYQRHESGEVLFCPCHNGAFSVVDGRVLHGPPPHPLPRIGLEIRGEEVWAVGVLKGGRNGA